MDLKNFKTDLTKEHEGTWVELGDGAAIKVARLNNPAFVAKFRDMPKHQAAALRRNTINDDELDRIFVEALVDAVLLDWRGMDENGSPLTYSKVTAIRVLSDPTYKDFRDLIVDEARDMENFREDMLDDTAKNSSSISDGSSGSEEGAI